MNKLTLALFLALAPTAFASTWYVDGVNGNDQNDCKTNQTACKTIGHAISLAASRDSISVAAATYSENLTISISLKVIGAGAMTTIINDGVALTPVVVIGTNANVTLSNITIRNGKFGGIGNVGSLVIDNSTISGNTASVGGGITNSGSATIKNSTISGNLSTNSMCTIRVPCLGGGIFNSGTVVISDSTISGNTAGGGSVAAGGGIYNTGTLTARNSTLSGNDSPFGGNIFAAGGNPNLENSIVSNSLGGGNCYGTITSDGYNLSSDNTCNFRGPGDMNNTDPKLGPLQYNGGPTQTQALLSGSPSIDAGNPAGCTDANGQLLKTDQRGKPRPDKEDSGGCDMGAYERQSD